MKKLLAIALSFSFFVLSVNAQVSRDVNPSQKTQSDSTHRMHRKMIGDLNLTQAQKAQMKELHQNTKQQRDAIKNDASLTPEQQKTKMQDLHKSEKDKMNSILTPEQNAKMIADRKNWKGHGKRNMMNDLNLSADQKAQMKANRDDMKKQSDAIRNDASLSPDQQKIKMQDLHKSEKDKMNSILTPEQKAKLEADRKNRSNKRWNERNLQDSTKNS